MSSISSGLIIKFGIVGWGVCRNTLSMYSVMEGSAEMSVKLGASTSGDFSPLLTPWHCEHRCSAKTLPLDWSALAFSSAVSVIKTTVARTKDTGVGNFTLFSRFTREPVRCPPGGGPECSARHHSVICAIRNPLRCIKPAAYPDPSLDPASADAGKRPPPAPSLIAFHGQVSCRKTWGRYAQDRVPMRSKVPAVNQAGMPIVTTRWAERLASSPRGNPPLR